MDLGLRGTVAALVALLFLTSPSISRADVDAVALLQEGILRYKLGKFEGSIKALKQATRKTRKVDLLGKAHLYLGLNHGTLGRSGKARKALKFALTHDPSLILSVSQHKQSLVNLLESVRRQLKGKLRVTAPDPGAVVALNGKKAGKVPLSLVTHVGRYRVEVRSADGAALFRDEVLVHLGKEAHVAARLVPVKGWLTITTEPPGAKVLMAGQQLGLTPLKRAVVAPGDHQLTLRKAGFVDQHHQAQVQLGREVRFTAKLQPASGAEVGPAEKPVSDAPSGRVDRPRQRRWLWTWFAAGGAVAAGAAGLGLGLATRAEVDQYNELSPGDTTRQQELEQSIRDKATASNVMFGVAGGLAVTAALLFYLEGWVLVPRQESAAAGARVTPVVGPTSGVLLTVPF